MIGGLEMESWELKLRRLQHIAKQEISCYRENKENGRQIYIKNTHTKQKKTAVLLLLNMKICDIFVSVVVA